MNPRLVSVIHFIVLLVILVGATACSAKDQVPWVADLSTAQQVAASTNQLVMVHFTADWCGPCQRLEKSVFSEKAFSFAVTQDYVPVKINVSEHPDLATRFNVSAWPTDILMTHQGHELHRMVSPQSSQEYLHSLRQVSWRYKNSAGMPHSATASLPNANLTPPTSMVSGTLAESLAERLGGRRSNEIQQVQFIELQPPLSASTPSSFGVANGTASAEQVALAAQSSAQPGSAWPQRDRDTEFQPVMSIPNGAQTTLPAGGQTASNEPVGQMVANEFVSHPPHVTPAPFNGAVQHAVPSADTTLTSYQPLEPMRQPVNTTSVDSTPRPTLAELRLGLEGYCPITLIEGNEWMVGDKRWGARHRGNVYLFQSAAAQQMFLADPDRYSPVLGGFDPVLFIEQGQYTAGSRAHGIRFRDTIVLFSSEETLERFSSQPDQYLTQIKQSLRAFGANR